MWLYYVEPQGTPKNAILSIREIIKFMYVIFIIFSSSFLEGLCALNTRACLVCTENRVYAVCTCILKKRNNHEGGDREQELAIN